MIAPTIPSAYDATGKKVLRPFDHRRGLHPTFPMGRYVSQPLTVKCTSLEDVRQFLRGCRAVSDQEQFDKRDYWQPPDEFEKTRKGDCDCFALWTWRQLLDMGYDARVVFGQAGRYGTGHAWVEFFRDGTCFLVEPQLRMLDSLPRLTTVSYHPTFSVAWDGTKLSYYRHKEHLHGLGFAVMMSLVPEYVGIWGLFWLRNLHKIPRLLRFLAKKLFTGFHLPGRGDRQDA